MDYSKFFAKIANRRQPNLIRRMAEDYIHNPSAISFASGMPNAQTFPFKEVNVTCKDESHIKLKDRNLDDALQYGPTKGYLPLVAKWKELQKKWHNPKFENWDVHFTSGSQDGISKMFDMLIDVRDPVMVQIPTYSATLGALLPLLPEFIGIEQDQDGIIPEQIYQNCKKRLETNKPMPKFLYVNPIGANPTGTVLPEERKKEIYELAEKYDFLILEDDAYYFLHFMDDQPTSFLSIDTDGRVIRFDSFSKIFSAGLRLGAVTAHKDILGTLSLHFQCSNLQPSSLSQILIYKLFESWSDEKYEQHFKGIQKFYRERRDIMIRSLTKHLTGLAEWSTPKAGMFVWLKITALEDVYDVVMKKCINQGLFVITGHAFNSDPTQKNQNMRICYSHVTEEEIEKGLSVLSNIIKEEIASRTNKK
ncbi:kynurenine/alpha-aminoadipate aminotransferase, mitochondrial-like [Belonocnema kinseyi]|uniref:kynurenine/alpha-aminoadipate aminotransferase, mitochondrial-like n=1 Tax=Belonocnema kinseyi TaxID=2817044 RepID=UPI00143D2EEE|nr:kynurenine/alpha-aminoadipate aminotransferase, mitochondrial-like [Belonocnema kinseyi]